ncbi:MAG: FAD-dependent oxidoreductase, partial [Planctomycetes bacterium]|nr:FAD-dependent oxidoreductase [Planctomycetota bacterium]
MKCARHTSSRIYSFGRHFAWPNAGGFPGGEHVIDPRRGYLDTLRRHGSPPIAQAEAFRRERLHGVIFEPDTYAKVVEEMLAETGRCAVLKNTGFASVQVKSGRVVSLRLDNGADVEAAAYVDATADGLLCLACGCEAMMGQEARTAFNEPHAPEHATHHINGLTLIYRITPTDKPGVEPLPSDVPSKCWWRSSFPSVSCVQYPCGDRNMNMLPTMEGAEFLGMSYSAAYAECRRRVLSHWHHCQTVFPEFQRYRLSWIAPALGVRETRRIKGEYVLTEHDLRAGLSKQTPPD